MACHRPDRGGFVVKRRSLATVGWPSPWSAPTIQAWENTRQPFPLALTTRKPCWTKPPAWPVRWRHGCRARCHPATDRTTCCRRPGMPWKTRPRWWPPASPRCRCTWWAVRRFPVGPPGPTAAWPVCRPWVRTASVRVRNGTAWYKAPGGRHACVDLATSVRLRPHLSVRQSFRRAVRWPAVTEGVAVSLFSLKGASISTLPFALARESRAPRFR